MSVLMVNRASSLRWNDGLDGQALSIASTQASPLRVTAGPGTGKTFALIRRLARILEEGQDPTRILLVTFTRVSAADLQRELDRLGLPQGQIVTKGTLHSLCFSILHRRHVLEFTQRVARPLLKFEERFLLEDLRTYGEFGTIHERRATLKAFEAAWARQQDQEPGWPTNPVEQAFQSALDEWLRFHQAMLIDELVPLTLRYLRANPGCPELRQFDHVLVDEYQDLNRAEQDLIDLLAQNASLAVVGDQDQAIYEGFRYAHPEGIALFHKTHQGTRDLPLDISRRCPAAIVALANSLIRNNQRRSGRQLEPTDDQIDVGVHLIQWPDMQSEAEGIADHIASRVLSAEYDPGRILVLCPRRHFGYLIRDQLRARMVDAHSYFHEEALEGNPKRIDESSAQQAFALLTLLAFPRDRVALRAWLGFGSQTLHANGYRRLRAHSSESNVSTFDAMRAISERTLTLPYTTGLSRRYNELNQRLRELRSLDPPEAFHRLFPAEEEWAEPFRTIYDQAGEPPDHEGALDLLRTNITQPDLPATATFVRVMSLHKSKGLTADHVFVAGCVEGLIPSYLRGLPFEPAMRFREEQRRLFYVAITRARRTLVLSSTLTLPRQLAYRMGAPVRGGDSLHSETIASTFLSELGDSCPPSLSGQDWLLGGL